MELSARVETRRWWNDESIEQSDETGMAAVRIWLEILVLEGFWAAECSSMGDEPGHPERAQLGDSDSPTKIT